MSHPVITYEEAVAAIGVLPSLAPRPCATNIRALETDLTDKLIIVPSEQTADLGYSGLVNQDAVYALQTNTPWENFADPGQVPVNEVGWTREQIEANNLLHAARKGAMPRKATSGEQRTLLSTRLPRACSVGYREVWSGFEPSAQRTTLR